jgi:hypothetical protein
MKITLHLITLQTPINPTRIRNLAPAHPRSLGKLASGIAAYLANNMVHVSVRLLRAESVIVLMVERLVFVRTIIGLVVTLLHPELPGRFFALKKVACDDAVAGGILDVYAKGVAGHVNDYVEVELEVVGDALFNAEVVVFAAAPPCFELGEAEEGADEEDEDGPLTTAVAWGCVGGLRLGWREVIVSWFWSNGGIVFN